jgi:hypothetical protein
MYVRDPAEARAPDRRCGDGSPPARRCWCSAGDVCRVELLVEIEAVQPLR